jgi:hypothetical protein
MLGKRGTMWLESTLKAIVQQERSIRKMAQPFSPVVLARAAARFRLVRPDVAGTCLPGLSAIADEFQHHAALSIALGRAGDGDAVEALAYQPSFAHNPL